MSDSNKISKAPPPITPIRGGGSFSSLLHPNRNSTLPDWSKWKYMPEVDAWQACALALNFEPDEMMRPYQSWMAPGADIFLPESFPSDEVAGKFAKLMDIVKANRLQSIYYRIKFPEFAAWCAPVVRDLTGHDIPPELAALAKDAPAEAATDTTTPGDDIPGITKVAPQAAMTDSNETPNPESMMTLMVRRTIELRAEQLAKEANEKYFSQKKEISPQAENEPAVMDDTWTVTSQSGDSNKQAGIANRAYWRAILQSHINKIDENGKAGVRKIINYMRKLGDERLPNEGELDTLTWIDDVGTKQSVVKKTVSTAASTARKKPP